MWSSRLSRNYFIIVYQRLGGNYCFRLQGGMRREVPPQRRKHIWNYMMSDDHDSNHSSVLLKSWSPSLLSYHLIFDFFLYLFFNDRFFLPFSTFRSLSLVLSFLSFLFLLQFGALVWSWIFLCNFMSTAVFYHGPINYVFSKRYLTQIIYPTKESSELFHLSLWRSRFQSISPPLGLINIPSAANINKCKYK